MGYTALNFGLDNKTFTQNMKTQYNYQSKLQNREFLFNIGSLFFGGLLNALSNRGGGNVGGGGNNNSIFTTAQNDRTQTPATPTQSTPVQNNPVNPNSPTNTPVGTPNPHGPSQSSTPTGPVALDTTSVSSNITASNATINQLSNMLDFDAQADQVSGLLAKNGDDYTNTDVQAYQAALDAVATAEQNVEKFVQNLNSDKPRMTQLQGTISAGEEAGKATFKFPGKINWKVSEHSKPPDSEYNCKLIEPNEDDFQKDAQSNLTERGKTNYEAAMRTYQNDMEDYYRLSSEFKTARNKFNEVEKAKSELSKFKQTYGDKLDGEPELSNLKGIVQTKTSDAETLGNVTVDVTVKNADNTTTVVKKTVKEVMQQGIDAAEYQKRFGGEPNSADLTEAKSALDNAKKLNNEIGQHKAEIDVNNKQIDLLNKSIDDNKEMSQRRYDRITNKNNLDKKGFRAQTKFFNVEKNQASRDEIARLNNENNNLSIQIQTKIGQRDAHIEIAQKFINAHPSTSAE